MPPTKKAKSAPEVAAKLGGALTAEFGDDDDRPSSGAAGLKYDVEQLYALELIPAHDEGYVHIDHDPMAQTIALTHLLTRETTMLVASNPWAQDFHPTTKGVLIWHETREGTDVSVTFDDVFKK